MARRIPRVSETFGVSSLEGPCLRKGMEYTKKFDPFLKERKKGPPPQE